MKYLLTTILFLSIFCTIYAQVEDCPTCPCIIELGDKYSQKRKYADAIDMYNAATACDINLKDEADQKIKVVFKKIEKERDDAIAAEKRAIKAEEKAKQSLIAEQKAKEESKAALIQAQTAEQKAKEEEEKAKQSLMAEEKALKQTKISEQKAIQQKKIAEEQRQIAEEKTENLQAVLDALYFYEDSLALAYDGYDFGFINKNGEVLIDYKYEEALPFDYTGYAKVKKGNTYYLIDTDTSEYRMTDDIKQLNENIEAFDFRNQYNKYIWSIDLKKSNRYISPLPLKVQKNILQKRILRNTQLKILLLSNFGLKKLLPEIGELSNLQSLYLYGNELRELPSAIGQLSNLQELDLSLNQLTELPSAIGELSNLQSLYLSSNELTELPSEIGQLSNLQSLDLRANNFSKEEKQKIKKLLPNCRIYF